MAAQKINPKRPTTVAGEYVQLSKPQYIILLIISSLNLANQLNLSGIDYPR
jgi:hypothetical protein